MNYYTENRIMPHFRENVKSKLYDSDCRKNRR